MVLRNLCGAARRLSRDTDGTIAVVVAVSLVALIGLVALVIEASNWYAVKAYLQRTADGAAMAGALQYVSDQGSTNTQTAARDNAAANGAVHANTPSSDSYSVTTAIVASPSGTAGSEAVQATVTKYVPTALSRVMTNRALVPVTAIAEAQIAADAPGCLIATNDGSGTGIDITGNVTITNCTLRSAETGNKHPNASVEISGNSTVDGNVYVGENSDEKGSAYHGSNTTFSGSVNAVDQSNFADPEASNSTATTLLADVNSSSLTPAAPALSTSGGAKAVTFKSGCTGSAACGGAKCNGGSCTLTLSAGCCTSLTLDGTSLTMPMTVTLNASAGYSYPAITIQKGTTYPVDVTFTGNTRISGTLQVSGLANVTFSGGSFQGGAVDLSGMTGGSFSFNPSAVATDGNIYSFGGDVTVSGSAATTFGSGTYQIAGVFADPGSSGGQTLTMQDSLYEIWGNNTNSQISLALGTNSASNVSSCPGSATNAYDGTNVTFVMAGLPWLCGGNNSSLAAPCPQAYDGTAATCTASPGVAGLLMYSEQSYTKNSFSIPINSQTIQIAGVVDLYKADYTVTGGASSTGCLVFVGDTITFAGNTTLTACKAVTGQALYTVAGLVQ